MKTTIIYAHPYEKSLNHALLVEIKQKLSRQGQAFEVIDLYQDGFNPVYSKEELALFNKGQALDPLIQRYQALLKESSRLIFIYPIWWSDAPAIVKGFFDKVFLKEFAYREKPSGMLEGLLPNIQEALVFSTSAGPSWFQRFLAGNASQKIILKTVLKSIGVKKGKWFNIGSINKKSQEELTQELKKAVDLV